VARTDYLHARDHLAEALLDPSVDHVRSVSVEHGRGPVDLVGLGVGEKRHL
jgi:hypothetical protein